MNTIGRYYNHDPRHYRFMRECSGLGARREVSSGLAWWLAGAVCGALILMAVVM